MPGVIQNYNICIVKTMKFDSNLLSRAEKMKLIMQYGVGLEGTSYVYQIVINRAFGISYVYICLQFVYDLLKGLTLILQLSLESKSLGFRVM